MDKNVFLITVLPVLKVYSSRPFGNIDDSAVPAALCGAILNLSEFGHGDK